MPTQRLPAPTPTHPAASQPTAYMSRVVATGLASAAGAVFTSLVDVRGTLIGAVLVAMTVSALGQAMREPLDRLERRLKGLGAWASGSEPHHAKVARRVPAPAAQPSAPRGGGVVRSILLIGLMGFTIGMGAVGAREIIHTTNLGARIMHKLQPLLVGNAAPTLPESVDEDADATPEQPASRAPAAPDTEASKNAPITELAKKVAPGGLTTPPSAGSGQSAGTGKSAEPADKAEAP